MSETPDVVVLSVPATARHAATARVVGASLAADAGFDADEIDDLRLAINEAVALLVDDPGDEDAPDAGDTSKVPTDRLELELRSGPGWLEVAVRRPGHTGPPELDELADRILTSVVDHHELRDGVVRLRRATATAA